MRRSELIHLNVKAFVRFIATLSPGARFLDRQPHRSSQDCIDLGDVTIMSGKMLIRSRLSGRCLGSLLQDELHGFLDVHCLSFYRQPGRCAARPSPL